MAMTEDVSYLFFRRIAKLFYGSHGPIQMDPERRDRLLAELGREIDRAGGFDLMLEVAQEVVDWFHGHEPALSKEVSALINQHWRGIAGWGS